MARDSSAANLPTPIWRAAKRGARGNALFRSADLCHLYSHAKQTQFLCRRHARSGIGAAQGPELDRRPAGGGNLRWHGEVYRVSTPERIDTESALAAFNPVQRALLRIGGVDGYVRLADAGSTT